MLTLHQIKQRLEELESVVFGEASSRYITTQEITTMCREVFDWSGAPTPEQAKHLARLINTHFHVPLEEDH